MNQKNDETLKSTSGNSVTYSVPKDRGMVCEAVEKFTLEKHGSRKLGPYTIEDYRNWPQEERVELIDGEIIKMAAPNFLHQYVAGEVYYQIKSYIAKKGGNCFPAIAPFDVQLDEDEYTMLQPDVLISCNRDKWKLFGLLGSPDFILEVISPSNPKHDYVKKLAKYEAAGVREYWILDLYKKAVLVYEEKTNFTPCIYPIEGKIGVGIYDNDLMIDLDTIKDFVAETNLL